MATGRPAGERIDRVLIDIVRPADYVRWEYLSRQRLLATNIVKARGGAPTRILDIGCGQGALSLTLSESAGLDVVAMDLLPERVSAVRARGSSRSPGTADRVRIVLANAESLPFHGESFDAVVATEVLEHVDNPAQMFLEVRRVLRPDGRFFMTTPNAEALTYRVLRFLPRAAVDKLAASLVHECLHPELLHDHAAAGSAHHPDRHRREGFTIAELEGLGDQAGIRMQRAYTYRIPIPDRVMGLTPRRLSRPLASLGTRHLPLGLQLYAEFMRP